MPALLFFSFLSLCLNISVFLSHFYFFEPLIFNLSALLSHFVVTSFCLFQFFNLLSFVLTRFVFFSFSVSLMFLPSLFTFSVMFPVFVYISQLPFMPLYFFTSAFFVSSFIPAIFLFSPIIFIFCLSVSSVLVSCDPYFFTFHFSLFHLFFPPTSSCLHVKRKKNRGNRFLSCFPPSQWRSLPLLMIE